MSTSVVIQSISDLEEQLSTLTANARASGLDADTIVQTLLAEMQYTVNTRHVGHDIEVQLIDFGLDERAIEYQPRTSRHDMLQTRSMNK